MTPRAVDEGPGPLLDAALVTLRERVAAVRFVFDTPGVGDAREAQREILGQLDNYVLPRLRELDAPLLVVIAGSTGAGKSTLVNSLARASVTATGVRRPTTRAPFLACHPDDASWFERRNVLPGLTRVRDAAGREGTLAVIAAEGVPRGVGLLDTPDIDSVVGAHHKLAHELVAAADLWVFMTTAARYADAIPWNLLHAARERGVTLGVTLNRVPRDAAQEILEHLRAMLDDGGLAEAELFVVPETQVSGGMLGGKVVEPVRSWLTEIVTEEDRRAAVVRGTLRGVLDSFRTRVPSLAKQVEAQVSVAETLRERVDAAYEAALAEIDETLRNGSLLRGEVIARWQDFVTTADLHRALQAGRRPLRRRAHAPRHGAPEQDRALEVALTNALVSLIRSGAEHAAEDAVGRWRADPAGSGLLAAAPESLTHASPQLPHRAAQAVSTWRQHVVNLVRSEGTTKRSVARIPSFDPETLALLLMVGALGQSGGDAASASPSALPQRLLRGIFGAESLRTIATKTRTELRARVSGLLEEEATRFTQAIEAAGVPDESAVVQLYQATYTLEVAR
ncbi:MAG: AAA family ATPase [Streptosporangiales bacterium]|nr:AAA family ATPase [Streptosporangiales bacterium]